MAPHHCKVSIPWRPSCPTFTHTYLHNASTHPHQTHHITCAHANEYNYNKSSLIFADHMIQDIIISRDTPTYHNHMHQLMACNVLSTLMYNSATLHACLPHLRNFVKMNITMGAFKGSHLPGIRVETHTNRETSHNQTKNTLHV